MNKATILNKKKEKRYSKSRVKDYFKSKLINIKNLFVKKKSSPPPPSTVYKKPGLQCPRCQFLIEISLPMLLSGQPIFCNQCYLRLNIDQGKSKQALDAVHKLNLGLKKAEEHKDSGKLS